MIKYITLDRLLDILQSYKDNFGGNIPILLSDKDSPNSLTNLVGAYVIDIMDPKAFEEDCEENCNDEPEEVFYEDD